MSSTRPRCVAARQRIALLERSLDSLRESERRASARLKRLALARDRRAPRNTRSSVTPSTRRNRALEAARQERAATPNAAPTRPKWNERRATKSCARRPTGPRAPRRHAEALARALDELSGAGGRAIIGELEGVLGAFLDLIEIDGGWERAVESAAGASVGAMVVDGRRSARASLEALRRENGAGLILPVAESDIVAPATPDGCEALRPLVRARRKAPAHVTRVLDALFSRAFIASDWETGMDVALANPELIIVTRDGDRFASSGWRIASGRAVVTRSAVEEAQAAAREATNAVTPVRERTKERGRHGHRRAPTR